MDFYIPKGNIGIEIDGPSHYLCPSREPSGSTIAKRRYLNACFDNFHIITGNTVWKPESCVDTVVNQI